MSSPSHPLIARDKPWLAPLAGYSDLPFRLLCREHGAGAACTEMVSAKGLVYGGRNTDALLQTAPGDDPLVVQLFGAEPSFVARAMDRLLDAGFAWFDLNAGCPVPKVVKTGAGAGLLREPGTLAAVVRAMVDAAGPGRVGVKFRLGWDPGRPGHVEFGQMAEQAGAAWLTLHPRFARQGFGGSVRPGSWGELARAVSVPVLASGDLFTAEDGAACLEQGAHGVMFARGALKDPAVFARFMALVRGLPLPEAGPAQVARVALRHLALSREHGSDGRSLLRMRHQAARYLRGLPEAGALRKRLVSCRSWEELEALLREAFGAASAAEESTER